MDTSGGNVGFSVLPKDASTCRPGKPESNHRPSDWWATALPTELQPPHLSAETFNSISEPHIRLRRNLRCSWKVGKDPSSEKLDCSCLNLWMVIQFFFWLFILAQNCKFIIKLAKIVPQFGKTPFPPLFSLQSDLFQFLPQFFSKWSYLTLIECLLPPNLCQPESLQWGCMSELQMLFSAYPEEVTVNQIDRGMRNRSSSEV